MNEIEDQNKRKSNSETSFYVSPFVHNSITSRRQQCFYNFHEQKILLSTSSWQKHLSSYAPLTKNKFASFYCLFLRFSLENWILQNFKGEINLKINLIKFHTLSPGHEDKIANRTIDKTYNVAQKKRAVINSIPGDWYWELRTEESSISS